MNNFNEAVNNKEDSKSVNAQMPSSFYVRFCVDRSDILNSAVNKDIGNISRFVVNNDPQFIHLFFERVSLKYAELTSSKPMEISNWQACFLRRKSLLLDREVRAKSGAPGFFLAPLNESEPVCISVSDYIYKTDARFAGLIATCLTMHECEAMLENPDEIEDAIKKTLSDLVLIHLKNRQIKNDDKNNILEAYYLFLEFLRPKPIDKLKNI